MGHDPIHDWLDMVVRKLLCGEKNAYEKYKKRKEREKRQDQKYDINKNNINESESSSWPVKIRTGQVYNNASACGPDSDPLGGSGRPMRAYSMPSSTRPFLNQNPQFGFQRGSQRGALQRLAFSQHKTSSHHNSHLGSFTGWANNIPSRTRGTQPNTQSNHRAASNTRNERVPTERYPLGDMTRSYVEGAVLQDQERPCTRRFSTI